jgi:hypothetical protein
MSFITTIHTPMKKALLLLTTILSIVTISHAQKWSAGYRTGFRQLESPPTNDPYGKDKIAWTNQVFLNRKITKRLETELTLDYTYKNHGTSSFSYFDGPALVVMDQQTTMLTAGLYLRYYIYQYSRVRIFGQAGFTSHKSWTNYQALSYDYPNSSPAYYSGTLNSGLVIAHTVAIGAGVSYDLSYRFYLNSLFNVNYYTGGAMRMSGSDPLARAAYVGLGFRF